MNIHRAKKLPVVVEVTDVITPENIAEIAAWCGAVLSGGPAYTLTVITLEGPAYTIGVGNRIIRGVRGEHYPIAETIFRETYRVLPPPPTAVERGWQRDAANQRWVKVLEEGADGPVTVDVTDEQLRAFETSQRANGQDLLRGVRGSERLERCCTWLATQALATSGGSATTDAGPAAEIAGAH